MSACDLTFTLAGQTDSYWAGDYGQVIEGNPIPKWLLRQHPAALVAVIALWIAAFSTAIHLLSDAPARVVAFVVMLGHACAASGWLLQRPLGVILCVGLFLVAKWCDKLIWTDARSLVHR